MSKPRQSKRSGPRVGRASRRLPAPIAAEVPSKPAVPTGWTGAYDRLFPAADEVACFRDPVGGIIDISDAFAAKFGKRPDRWIGVQVEEIVHRDDLVTFARIRQLLQRPPFQTSVEVRCRTQQGWRWMLWEETCCRDTNGRVIAVRAVGRDVTRRHMAEEHSYILSQAVEQNPIATAIADTDGCIRYVNTRYAEMAGTSLETLLEGGERIFREAHPTEEAYQAFLTQLQNGRPWRGEVSGHNPNGDPRWEFVQVVPIRTPNQAVAQLLMLREDITERKLLEAQLRQAQKMESVGTLAGGIAHDFNNLLSIINGYSEILLSREGQDDRTQRFLGEIFKAGQRAVGLVRQILAFSRKAEMVSSPLELNPLIQELAGMLQETFPRTITFNFQLDPALPSLLADHNQVQQILMNLCVNARDAMPDGGTLTLGTSRVRGRELARLGADAGRIYQCIRVSDSGVGIPAATLQRIFEPFFTTKEKGSGTGLGLAVVEGIVSRHEGFVDVSSAPGQGSTFRIYLPEATVPAAAAAEVTMSAPAARGSGRILVVEDEESLRNMTHDVLSSRGFEVSAVTDGAKALDFLDEHPGSIDCVILDVNMPRLNGVSVFQVIQRKYPELRVIVVSGYLSADIKQQFLDLGQDIFIHKPFRVDEVINKVNQVLAPARAAT